MTPWSSSWRCARALSSSFFFSADPILKNAEALLKLHEESLRPALLKSGKPCRHLLYLLIEVHDRRRWTPRRAHGPSRALLDRLVAELLHAALLPFPLQHLLAVRRLALGLDDTCGGDEATTSSPPRNRGPEPSSA